MLIAGGFFFSRESKIIPAPKQEAKFEVSTKYGSRTDIQLPDGSKVWLNSGSTLTYDKQFGKEIREVVLSGEAFFDVVKNAEKPFIIHTTSMDIKVLGTRFNVKSYSGDKLSEATLIHGSIEVSLKKRASEKILLKPNEKILVMNDQVVREGTSTLVKNRPPDPIIAVQKLNYDSKDSTVIETSWVDHKLIFKNESFEDIAIKMERWFGTHVEFEDPALKQERLTGSFTTETIEEALNALQISTKFTYLKRYNTLIITK
jgi:ferric-dicitrate binding protein FerR (iron transport regulator)